MKVNNERELQSPTSKIFHLLQSMVKLSLGSLVLLLHLFILLTQQVSLTLQLGSSALISLCSYFKLTNLIVQLLQSILLVVNRLLQILNLLIQSIRITCQQSLLLSLRRTFVAVVVITTVKLVQLLNSALSSSQITFQQNNLILD